jgi:hypothetical protein
LHSYGLYSLVIFGWLFFSGAVSKEPPGIVVYFLVAYMILFPYMVIIRILFSPNGDGYYPDKEIVHVRLQRIVKMAKIHAVWVSVVVVLFLLMIALGEDEPVNFIEFLFFFFIGDIIFTPMVTMDKLSRLKRWGEW